MLKVKLSPVAPERHLQKLKRSPFAGQCGGNAPKADCSTTLAVLPGESREVEPGPFSAAKEALMALMNVAIRVGSWTPAAVTGAATV